MVTIKIQSREDIIAAYLKSFGFCDDKLAAVVSAVTGNLQKSDAAAARNCWPSLTVSY